MGGQLLIGHGVAGMAPEHVDQVLKIHAVSRLVMIQTIGKAGQVHLNYSGEDLVTEILRLARVGALAETTARTDPTTRVAHVVHGAAEVWKLGFA